MTTTQTISLNRLSSVTYNEMIEGIHESNAIKLRTIKIASYFMYKGFTLEFNPEGLINIYMEGEKFHHNLESVLTIQVDHDTVIVTNPTFSISICYQTNDCNVIAQSIYKLVENIMDFASDADQLVEFAVGRYLTQALETKDIIISRMDNDHCLYIHDHYIRLINSIKYDITEALTTSFVRDLAESIIELIQD